MSKKRAALKFAAAGAVTGLMATATIRKWQGRSESEKATKEQVAIVAGMLTVLTWTAALA